MPGGLHSDAERAETIERALRLAQALINQLAQFTLAQVVEGGHLDFALVLRLADREDEPLPWWRVVRSMEDPAQTAAFLGEAIANIRQWDSDATHVALEPIDIGPEDESEIDG